jgi:hypothetical protein
MTEQKKCLGGRGTGTVCDEPRLEGRVFCATHAKLDRFSFLSAYGLRNKSEEEEVHRLKVELEELGLGDHGWPIVEADANSSD